MSEVVDAIRACRLWRGASKESVTRLTERARVTSAPAGAQLVTEGDAADEFGVVVSGKVRVYHLAPDGRRLTYEDLGATESFGAAAALSGGRYPANVEAVGPATVAWLSRGALFELLEDEPGVTRTLISDLARRIVNLTGVAQVLALDVPSRLARYLFQQSLSTGQATDAGLLIDLGMSKTELAAALGTVPETLSRALSRLREQGLIEVEGREIRVLDVGALAKMGSGYEEG